jgi:hypothetical protein
MGHIGFILVGDGIELGLTCPLQRIGLSLTLTSSPKPNQHRESGQQDAI